MDEGEPASPFSFVGSGGNNTGSATGLAGGDGWEPVPPPAPSAAAEENGRGWEVVTVGAAPYDDCSVFPPCNHEGLHLRPDPDLDPTLIRLHDHHGEAVGGLGESSYPPPPPPPRGEEEKMPVMRRGMSDSARRVIGLGLEVFHSKISLWRGGGLECGIGGVAWSVAALAGFVGALMFLRRRHRRENELLLLLLQEKDQRISQLLDQIALLNEIIAQRHRVSVLRKL